MVGVPDKPGVAAQIFRTIADAELNIDMVVQNISAASTGRTDISFTLPAGDGRKAIATLQKVQEQIGFEGLLYDDQIAKVSLVGAGMKTNPGVAAQMFETLANEQVNIEMISTSTIRISCVVHESDVERAVRALHTAFELEATAP